MNSVTIFEYDLREALAAINRIRADNPERFNEPVAMTIMSENYITGRKSHLNFVHDAEKRELTISELPA